LQDWLEYNKGKTGQLIKIVEREEVSIAKEQYIVIMFDRILEESGEPLFGEPFYGCFKINISINKFSINNGKFKVEDKIKFYFWINVGGLTTLSDYLGALHEVFSKYHFLKVLPR
jgi:hypothetical protein